MTAEPRPEQRPSAPEEPDEQEFAATVVKHLELHWKLLRSVPGSKLRLTKMDDAIHAHFRQAFPELDVAAPLDEETLKSEAQVKRWNGFIGKYEGKIEHLRFGTMLRKGPAERYDHETTMLVPRMQWYAIEIARNLSGANDWVYVGSQAEQGINVLVDTDKKDGTVVELPQVQVEMDKEVTR